MPTCLKMTPQRQTSSGCVAEAKVAESEPPSAGDRGRVLLVGCTTQHKVINQPRISHVRRHCGKRSGRSRSHSFERVRIDDREIVQANSGLLAEHTLSRSFKLRRALFALPK